MHLSFVVLHCAVTASLSVERTSSPSCLPRHPVCTFHRTMDDGVAELQQRLKSAEWKGEHVLVIKSKVSCSTTDTAGTMMGKVGGWRVLLANWASILHMYPKGTSYP